MRKIVMVVFALFVFFGVLGGVVSVSAQQHNMAEFAAGPSDGAIRIAPLKGFDFERQREWDNRFWEAHFIDNGPTSAVHVFLGRNMSGTLYAWKEKLVKSIHGKYARGGSVSTVNMSMRTVVLGSGQEVEFSLHRIEMNSPGIHERRFALATFLSKDGTKRGLIQIYALDDSTDAFFDHVGKVAGKIFFQDQ